MAFSKSPYSQSGKSAGKKAAPKSFGKSAPASARASSMPSLPSSDRRDSKRQDFKRAGSEKASSARREKPDMREASSGSRENAAPRKFSKPPKSARSGSARPAGARPAPPQRQLELAGPAAVVSRRAADRLRAGHVWVYQSDIEQIAVPAEGTAEAASGLLPVVDSRGIGLGTALYSPSSQIALRLVSTEQIDDAAWLALLKANLRAAIARRSDILALPDTDACRLVFSEADALPGLIVDKYGDLIIPQLLTHGMDRPEIRAAVVGVLRAELSPATIVERPDPRIREIEELSAPQTAPLYAEDPANPLLATTFRLNGLRFHYDSNSGQKTGAFLDQRENYAAAARHAHGDALDVCCYQGGFALHMATKCERVTGVDASRAALEVAEQNLALNLKALSHATVDWVEANAFDLLRDWSASGTQFDTIVLDPPAFAKSKRAVEGALRGYKELNLRALKMLRPGGTLITCSCSHHVSLADFNDIVTTAAGDARRRVRLLERRGASADHPVQLTIPETEYLKCFICVVE